MARRSIGGLELAVFGGGIACLLASTALGFYLAYQIPAVAARPNFEPFLLADASIEDAEVRADRRRLASVEALMWMSFGLGAFTTLVGLRMMTRPPLDGVDPPAMKRIDTVFENPD